MVMREAVGHDYTFGVSRAEGPYSEPIGHGARDCWRGSVSTQIGLIGAEHLKPHSSSPKAASQSA